MIKKANKKDAKLIKELAHEIWGEHYTPIIGSGSTEYMLAKFQTEKAITAQIEEGFNYYLFYDADEPCGYFAYRLEENEVFLSRLYVKKSKRGRGLAREATKHITREAAEQNKNSVYVFVNKQNLNSVAAYQKMGFVRAGERLLDIGGGFFMDDFKYILSIG